VFSPALPHGDGRCMSKSVVVLICPAGLVPSFWRIGTPGLFGCDRYRARPALPQHGGASVVVSARHMPMLHGYNGTMVAWFSQGKKKPWASLPAHGYWLLPRKVTGYALTLP
jgi:hypothetical protein